MSGSASSPNAAGQRTRDRLAPTEADSTVGQLPVTVPPVGQRRHAPLWSREVAGRAVSEARVGLVEDQADVGAGGAVAVFSDQQVGFAGARAVRVVVVLAVEEADQV